MLGIKALTRTGFQGDFKMRGKEVQQIRDNVHILTFYIVLEKKRKLLQKSHTPS
jgi:hypothetical protein